MHVYKITFSPTGGTKRAAQLLTQAWGGNCSEVDLTDSRRAFGDLAFEPDDLAVIAVPSYGGRVPALAVERLLRMRGNAAKAVLVCVYGNRAYEDTLVELQDTARQAGFRPVAGVAAVAEHSIARQYASGRPDEQDRKVLQRFAGQIQAKLSRGDGTDPVLPGNRPYKTWGGSAAVPAPTEGCTNCQTCAKLCPTQAIDPEAPDKTDVQKCISCMRCVAVCPHKARTVGADMLQKVSLMLEKVCSVRKEPELYL